MGKPKSISGRPKNRRKDIVFSEEEHAKVQLAADQVGLPFATFVRKVALAQQIRPARSKSSQELISTLNKLGGELNKVGSNLNQLAREANSGDFPAENSILHVLASVRKTVDDIVLAIKGV
jgi:hypothetical protein